MDPINYYSSNVSLEHEKKKVPSKLLLCYVLNEKGQGLLLY